MDTELKHNCHECGLKIAYPKHAFGQTVKCPECGLETTLGEIYPTAPSLLTPPSSAFSSLPGNPSKNGGRELDVRALNKQTHTDLNPADARKITTAGRIGIGGGLVLLLWCLIKFGPLVWNSYLQTDSAALGLLRESMLETFAKAPELKKPVEILKLTLDKGPNENRTASAVVSFGGEAETVKLKVKISRSFGSDLKVEWETADRTAAPPPKQAATTSPALAEAAQRVQMRNSMPPPDQLLLNEANQADELIRQVEATEDAVREAWNKGVKNEIGGQAQLALIRDQIVPLVRETRDRAYRYNPRSPKLQPVKKSLLELVQFDFNSWIAINNAAALGNWETASGLFSRMEIDRVFYFRKARLAVDAATSN